MILNEWVRNWDEKIRRWSENPKVYFENDDIYNVYNAGTESKELQFNALLEPYLGDVNDRCSGVILSINPGDPMLNGEQILPSGKFIKDGAAEKYSEWAKKWVYLTEYKNTFWSTRKEWIERIIEEKDFLPFGIELIPYHSKSWGTLKKDEKLYKYIDENILTIGEQMLDKSIFKMIICIGKDYEDTFNALNFKKIIEVNNLNYSELNVNWPKDNGRAIGRSYIVWKSNRGYYYLQIKSNAGFAVAPGAHFTSTEKDIIRIVEEKEGCKLVIK